MKKNRKFSNLEKHFKFAPSMIINGFACIVWVSGARFQHNPIHIHRQILEKCPFKKMKIYDLTKLAKKVDFLSFTWHHIYVSIYLGGGNFHCDVRFGLRSLVDQKMKIPIFGVRSKKILSLKPPKLKP